MEIAKRGEGPAEVPRVGEEGRRRGAPSLRGARTSFFGGVLLEIGSNLVV